MGRQLAGMSARAWIGVVGVPMAIWAVSAVAQPLTTTFAGGASFGGAMFDVKAIGGPRLIRRFETNVDVPAGQEFSYSIWTCPGSYVGNTSSQAAWTIRGGGLADSGGLGTPTLLTLWLAPVSLPQDASIGVFIVINASTPFLACTPIPPAQAAYTNSTFQISGGVGKATGGFTAATIPDIMWNGIVADGPECYANCDGSTVGPFLNVMDFVCFNNQFAAGFAAANCDGSTVVPVLNVNDFVCFNNRFAAGCGSP
ncbi:MAG: hypothetical protein ACKVW3_18015 [Phycisphaerales bacterium]